MTLFNEYFLNLDLKRKMTSRVPKLVRNDKAIFIMEIFDDGVEYNINRATKATMFLSTPSGVKLELDCTFITRDGKRLIRFEFEEIAMVEVGFTTCLLSIYSDDKVSVQPFFYIIEDDLKGKNGSYIELLQDILKIIDNLMLDLSNTVKLSEKGQPNGIATLDSNAKIPLEQMPEQFQAYLDHILQTVWEHKVHGMQFDEDGIMQYETPNGWQNVGFAPEAQGGGGGNHVLNATVSVVDGIANVLYTGIPTVTAQKWAKGDRDLAYFVLNGTTFTGVNFTVTDVGLHTLWYQDSNGNKYVVLFNVTIDQLPKPKLDIEVDEGIVTITPPVGVNIALQKWDKGSRNITYFQFNGNIFAGDSFEITEIGTYTVYIKTDSNLEYVYEFEVTQDMLPHTETNPPVITYTTNPPEGQYTNSDIEVLINVQDASPIVKLQYKQGYLSNDEFTTGGIDIENNKFIVEANGVFTVYAEDIHGNKATNRIFIYNIDKDAPTVTYDDIYKVTESELIIKATDSVSGIDYIELPNGTKVRPTTRTSSFEVSHTVATIGKYTFKVADTVGNVRTIVAEAKGKIVKIAGNSFEERMVLYENGEVYGTSNNSNNMFGTDTQYVTQVKNQLLPINDAVDITTSDRTYVIVKSNGDVYGVGLNENGQLGLGHRNSVSTYTKLPLSGKVTKTIGKRGKMLYLVNDEWYSSGVNDGSLGNGAVAYTSTPTKITLPTGVNVTDMFFDNSSTYYKTNANLYATGFNSNGEIGIPYIQGQYVYVTSPTLSATPNAIGTTDKVLRTSSSAYFRMTNGDTYYIGYDYPINTNNSAIKVNGLPTVGEFKSNATIDGVTTPMFLINNELYVKGADALNFVKVVGLPLGTYEFGENTNEVVSSTNKTYKIKSDNTVTDISSDVLIKDKIPY